MEHLSEVVRILDAALMHDPAKAVAYANLLASKLEDEGQKRQARALRTVMAKLPENRVSPARAGRPPTDAEHSLSIVDIYEPGRATPDLVLHPYVQERVEEFLDSVRFHDAWEAKGLGSPSRLLIYGPPGTGKTSIANSVAERLGLPLVVSRSDALVSSLLGQTSRNIRSIFEYAESFPCVLFLDEFDALAKDRADAREIGELQRVVIALLQNVDAMHSASILIAATNHPELLDAAVWRRFEYTLRLDLPAESERMRIWEAALAGVAPPEGDLSRLVELSEGMSGAAIKLAATDISRVAAQRGVTELSLATMLRRVARLTWYSQYSRFDSEATEIVALREWAPDVFTIRALAEQFGISTRQVSNAIKG